MQGKETTTDPRDIMAQDKVLMAACGSALGRAVEIMNERRAQAALQAQTQPTPERAPQIKKTLRKSTRKVTK